MLFLIVISWYLNIFHFSEFLLSTSAKYPRSYGKTEVYNALDITCVELTFGDSSSEKKRRQIYRGEVHGQLPFDPRIPEEPVPSITDFSTTGGKYSEYAIERKDIEGSCFMFSNKLTMTYIIYSLHASLCGARTGLVGVC